jgi:hypothetical protein
MNEQIIRPLAHALMGILALVCLGRSDAHGEHWIPAPAPPEMLNDPGDWWLDTDSIDRQEDYTFFRYHRGAEKGVPPLIAKDIGRMAFHCSSGDTLVKAICSGSCLAAPAFPEGWLPGTHYSRDSFLFATVCKPASELPNLK